MRSDENSNIIIFRLKMPELLHEQKMENDANLILVARGTRS